MDKSYISIEKDISNVDEKRIKKNLKKIYSAIDELVSMGYSVYITPTSINVCDGDTHTGMNHNADQSVIVASMNKNQGLDCGDW